MLPTTPRSFHLLSVLLPPMLLFACTTQMGGKGSSVDHAEDTASGGGVTDTAPPPDTGPETPPDSGLDSGLDTAGGVETGGGEETGGGGEETPAGLVFTCADPTIATLSQVTANTFGSRTYYPAPYNGTEGGHECVCTFRLTGFADDLVTGVTAWMPTSTFDKTDWAPEEENANDFDRPLAVALLSDPSDPVSWIGVGSPSIDWGTDVIDFPSDTDPTDTPRTWFAFQTDTDLDDTPTYYIDPVGVVPINGTYEVHLSMVNSATTGEVLSSCSAFAGKEDDEAAADPARALHLRIDIAAAPPSEEAGLPPVGGPIMPVSPLSCEPGVTATTEAWLLEGENGLLRPVAAGGNGHLLGASIQEVTVIEWRGTERLQIRTAGGHFYEIQPGQPAIDLSTAALALPGSSWRAKRDSEGPFSTPRLRLRHSCPAAHNNSSPPSPPPATPGGPPTQPNGQVWALSWRQASDWLSAASGGLRLEQLGLPTTALDWPVFALRLKARPEGEPSFLEVEVEGVGSVHSFSLKREGEVYRFRQTDALGLLAGQLQPSGESLNIHLDSGRLDTAMGALDLLPSDLQLEVNHAPQ